MEARREARRRRILENAENRLKRVVDVQSRARKKSDDGGDDDGDDHCKTYEVDDDNSGPSSKASRYQDKTTVDENIPCDDAIAEDQESTLEKAKVDDGLTQNEQTTSMKMDDDKIDDDKIDDDKIDANKKPQYDAKMSKYIERRQMVYRMTMIFSLAFLLVLVSNLKVFENTRYGEVRKSSFLPYFITLELIIFCLFPIKRELSKSSLTLLLLKLFGVSDTAIKTFFFVSNVTTRIFQDFAWFIFTVVILNHFMIQI